MIRAKFHHLVRRGQLSNVKEVRHFINGAYVSGGQGEFENINPATGRFESKVHEADRNLVDQAVAAARNALNGEWGRLTVEARSKVLCAVADGINARFDEFLEAEIADTGKPVNLASHIDIPRGAANFTVFAELLKAFPTEAFQQDTPTGYGALNYSVRKPRGVLGVICPWNLPLLLMTWKVGPALACGNTVVVKPSEETPTTAAMLGEVMNDVGVPHGVYNVVQGLGPDSAGQYLTEHPDVDGITFTGETITGEAIMKQAARGIRPVSMELGGKNAGVVFADADLDKAVAGSMRSVFANCGQVCLNTERLYVERPVFEEFVERLSKGAGETVFGDPMSAETASGPLISEQHREKVLGYYEKAKADGAEVHTGGGVPGVGGDYDGGWWIQPTVWTGLKETDAAVKEEIFGPCVHVQPFDEQDEAIAMANDTDYGLATSIWTENLTKAHQVADQIDVGITWVNCWFLRDLRTPFGGSKASGIGREGGQHAFEFYTEHRNICIQL